MNRTLLRVEQLTTVLEGGTRPLHPVDGVDLEIRRGETFALLGESGCGKSMTALSIMRLLPPVGRVAGGNVWLGESNLLDLPETAMRLERGGRVGMIFQEPMTSLNPVLNIGEQIAESVRLHDPGSLPRLRQRVTELLQAVGIPDPARRAGEYPHQLSGGMKQRVMIAIALAGRPELLIADEPTTALDVTIQAQVLGLLKSLQQQTGMAILLITHDLGIVAEMADRVAVMYAGQIVETAPVAEFFGRDGHPYSRKLFDSLPGQEKRAARLAVIRGSVPSLASDFPGCRFAERCDRVMARCRGEAPGWRVTGPGRGMRCHLAETPWEAAVELSGRAGPGIAPAAPDVATAQSDRHGEQLSVEGLRVHFPIRQGVLRRTVGHVRAVDGVSFEIPPGRTLALVGESGCGKTTVGKGVLQLIRPSEGSVRFGADELTRLTGAALRRRRSLLQIIFQDPFSSMNPRMLVGDIIAEGMRAQGVGETPAGRRERVRQLLTQVGLDAGAAERYPHEFSGGQRQRICVARALAVQPRLIVCDEPTSALDVSVQAQILNLLGDLQRELGLSYLFITHNLSVVAYLAHEVAVMYLGRIVERGTVEEVLQAPRHPYTRALLSAVPVVDPEGRREVIRLEGDMPSPSDPPTGCHFHPRCPEAEPACAGSYPRVTRLSATHCVSCLRVGGAGAD
ncbi:MAG: ABC transporter ATP-binding protein [Candidatus Sedimenticola endophacoides]|uniref:ABC-type dipeptide transporter n=1 Tax=Candidatus Sedimenticola endophacoides TaxID=2548426 RepID=A0A6N4DT90_9GAMM|nr:MAG: ABC transporter ATP-binding protein [Candidatus Sedimenticola endophacoides]OQX35723.1 MAG: ABC transporter ATP-binding protein [Candidatus Sedimenticola endophacoides]OQX40994.1 MAG: ABC transporter ATP-binding protein [Candidatus Sedimenticola endophacoides]PUD99380.1 MAG: ABC transporter ATP-binding protein [Candidatus Sedimenticola endophacoides]PUE02184.1 MAG: ABC transporter ATP-binding protein [Candidatus Sedimenticola endophacoides]